MQQEVCPFEQVQRRGLINEEIIEITKGVGTEKGKQIGLMGDFFPSNFLFVCLNYIIACSLPRKIESADKQNRNNVTLLQKQLW